LCIGSIANLYEVLGDNFQCLPIYKALFNFEGIKHGHDKAFFQDAFLCPDMQQNYQFFANVNISHCHFLKLLRRIQSNYWGYIPSIFQTKLFYKNQ